MNLDLRDFETFPAEVAVESEPDNNEYGIEKVSFRDLMSLRLVIQKVQEEYYCQGSVTVPVEEECSRCLSLFDAELKGELNFIIRTGDGKVPSAAGEEEEILYVKPGEPVADLHNLIRESLILALPLKPLCNDDCLGLCPDCGVNLNEETCDCKREEDDERWEGLKNLLE
ncbi:conserved hypothetical protein [Candidatus Zixiibacteriota bacterium]|nr:conserved hypothetical protein [candidate division Zixibacteria bacterium]